MNPAGWPPEALEVFERSVTAEFATLTSAGRPITLPLTPYRAEHSDTLDVSTGLTYPGKAERARREPRVALLFADPLGAGLGRPPAVLVQGLATVRDADLQANTDRYVRASMAKLPAATERRPRAALRRMAWYYARIWIEVTPLHIRWWPSRALEEAPSTWDAPAGTAAPLSDPAPPGGHPGAWIAPPEDWRRLADDALARLPLADLTVVDHNGFPLPLPVADARLEADGVSIRLGPGAPLLARGPACLTMHGHAERFTGQENRELVGVFEPGDGGGTLVVERALPHWSLAGGPLRMTADFLTKGMVLRRRLKGECIRRGQAVPEVRLPPRA